MVINHDSLMENLQTYSSPKAKLTRMNQSGEIIRIKRGLYIKDRNVPPAALAPVIYGPSYLSFEYALAEHGLIPERVFTLTSASFNKNKNRSYDTPLGRYEYSYLPARVYPYGITRIENGGQPYLLATPEKALCDTLYKYPPMSNPDEMGKLLKENLRIEKKEIFSLDLEALGLIVPLYRRSNLRMLLRWLKKEGI